LEGQFNRLLEQAAEQMEAQDYMAQFQRITDEITTLKEQRAQIEEQRTSSAVAVQRMATTAALMEKMSPELTEWDESWIRQLVDTVKVLSEVAIIVYLRGGIEIRQSIKK
jgi:predicted phosphoadenosine phosphosulfate sulfurtransferase